MAHADKLKGKPVLLILTGPREQDKTDIPQLI